MMKTPLTPDSELTLNISLTVREWAYAAGVLGCAVDMALAAGKNTGGMPEDVAHVTASADKLRQEIVYHPDLGGYQIITGGEVL